MVNSQNGWPASPNRGDIGVDPGFSAAGVTFPGGVKSGDVATVLQYVAEQFHARVEPLRVGWCWGWNYREIRGATSISNHASGTAIDCNAPLHNLGDKGTFSKKQVDAIHTILMEVGYVVRWGGDYSGRVDEMHFEINASAASVKSVAARLRSIPDKMKNRRDNVIYIECETEGPGKGVSIALLDAPFFVNLVGNEWTSARGNIDKGIVPSQWVDVETWRHFDKRSHALFDAITVSLVMPGE